MKRVLRSSVGVLTAFLVATSAFAASTPVITGVASGHELCFQFICGTALFGGETTLKVDGKTRKGTFFVSATHESPLPTTEGASVAILDGDWVITTKKEVFSGDVAGGSITKNADNTFAVEVVLDLDTGGTGTIYFTGTLSHDDFTIVGEITQEPQYPTSPAHSELQQRRRAAA